MKLFSAKWLWIVIVVLLFFNGTLLYKNYLAKQSRKEILTQLDVYKNSIEKQSPLTYSYKGSFKTSLLNDGLYLADEIFTDSLRQKIKFSQLFTKDRDKILVLKFSELNCIECVMYAIVKLRKIAETIGVDNIVFIGSYQDNRNLHIQKKHLGLQGMNVYNIPQLNLPIEESVVPYYFLLDKTLKVSNVFVPEKSTPELTNIYLDLVIDRYF
ncbi:hypothetical protein FACS1894176_10120 [Bacteroidia bacterium]|nr:hypothetical protein FACS1894176_10120 [Bacteroidia bacterium]